jgi:hypothetical protein
VIRRAPLFALLVYVTLDLSSPAMPGAFVFEADDSVESVHAGRGRSVAYVVLLSRPAGDPLAAPVAHPDPTSRPRVAGRAPRDSDRAVSRLPRAALAHVAKSSTALSEDLH